MNNLFYKKGFTLIELLVVITIIALLSSIITSNMQDARVRARDAKRMTDLQAISVSLEMYYDLHRTYRVEATGYDNNGIGWLAYERGLNYFKAVTRGLYEEGLLGLPILDDPVQDPGYMIYLCDNGNSYAIFATKEDPSAEDINYVQKVCHGVQTMNDFGKNYAIANKTY